MRLERLILILAKEFIIGRHLWKWSISILFDTTELRSFLQFWPTSPLPREFLNLLFFRDPSPTPLVFPVTSHKAGKQVDILDLHIIHVGGMVVAWLACSPLEWAVRVQALIRDIVLYSWARHFTFTVLLSTQVYKWVPANLMLEVHVTLW